MTQCPVPAVPGPPPMLVLDAAADWTPEQVAEFGRLLAAVLAGPSRHIWLPRVRA